MSANNRTLMTQIRLIVTDMKESMYVEAPVSTHLPAQADALDDNHLSARQKRMRETGVSRYKG